MEWTFQLKILFQCRRKVLFGERENTFMAHLSINLLGVGLIHFSLLAGIPFALANLINNLIDHNLQKKQALLQLELDKKNNEYKAAEVDSLMSRYYNQGPYMAKAVDIDIRGNNLDKCAHVRFDLR